MTSMMRSVGKEVHNAIWGDVVPEGVLARAENRLKLMFDALASPQASPQLSPVNRDLCGHCSKWTNTPFHATMYRTILSASGGTRQAALRSFPPGTFEKPIEGGKT